MSLRLLHTSDWHLGRIFFGESLVDDQAHALRQLVDIAREERVDALLVAGDVYDRAVPPLEAVRLLDEVLTEVRRDLAIPVVVIAGNHDSGERLGFASRLLAEQGVHVRSGLAALEEPIAVHARRDRGGGAGNGPERCDVFAIPFVEPESVRASAGDDTIASHEQALRHLLGRLRSRRTNGSPAVAVAHAFVRGGEESPDSERPIAGGLGQVDADAFAGFDYVALGHLHCPQQVRGHRHVRYAGSLLKYSFGEAGHRKGVTLVELGAKGPRVEALPLSPRRDLHRLRGSLDELLSDPAHEAARQGYVEATLQLREGEYVLDAFGKLSRRFPYLRAIRHEQIGPPAREASPASARLEALVAGRDDVALLEAFLRQVTGTAPTAEAVAAFTRTMREVDAPDGEGGP